MARHFSGFVSRFSAGMPDTPSTSARLTDVLVRRGLSATGVRELLAAEPVTTLADRRALIGVVADALDLVADAGTSPVALLVPAVQAAREAARRTRSPGGSLTTGHVALLQQLGMSPQAVRQLVTAMPVSDADGRYVLTQIAHAARE